MFEIEGCEESDCAGEGWRLDATEPVEEGGPGVDRVFEGTGRVSRLPHGASGTESSEDVVSSSSEGSPWDRKKAFDRLRRRLEGISTRVVITESGYHNLMVYAGEPTLK